MQHLAMLSASSAYLQRSWKDSPVKAVVGNVGSATLEELCVDAASSHIKIVKMMIVLPLQQPRCLSNSQISSQASTPQLHLM